MFCQAFIQKHPLIYSENAFFTKEGLLADLSVLKKVIHNEIRPFAHTNVSKKISSLIELLKIMAFVNDLPPQDDRIHLVNGTLLLDRTFISVRLYVCTRKTSKILI